MDAFIIVRGWLTQLIKKRWAATPAIRYPVDRRASVKDVIEALGIPHTEVGTLIVNRQEIDFHHLLEPGDQLVAEPLIPPVDVTRPTRLRPRLSAAVRFLVDHNVARLAPKLRMAGFDTLFDPAWHDEELAAVAEGEGRILLSRDLQLLKRKNVLYGHLVRETMPARQLGEILHFYGLKEQLAPFGRCLRCNTMLTAVAKDDILHRLEPLTKKYYHSFQLCPGCGRIYWAGSHHDQMVLLMTALVDYQPLPC